VLRESYTADVKLFRGGKHAATVSFKTEPNDITHPYKAALTQVKIKDKSLDADAMKRVLRVALAEVEWRAGVFKLADLRKACNAKLQKGSLTLRAR